MGFLIEIQTSRTTFFLQIMSLLHHIVCVMGNDCNSLFTHEFFKQLKKWYILFGYYIGFITIEKI